MLSLRVWAEALCPPSLSERAFLPGRLSSAAGQECVFVCLGKGAGNDSPGLPESLCKPRARVGRSAGAVWAKE